LVDGAAIALEQAPLHLLPAHSGELDEFGQSLPHPAQLALDALR
jgi:hypothetical protein